MSDKSDLEFHGEVGQFEGLFAATEIKACVNGVTHDVNNFLGAILAYSELIQLDSELNDDCERMLMQIIDGVTQCSGLLSSLTEVARKGRPVAKLTDMAKLVKEVLALRCYDLKVKRIATETKAPPELTPITTDRPKLKLAMLYMITNAVEALKDIRARRIKVTLRETDDAIEIQFWNSAPHIPDDRIETLFQPCYSIKDSPHINWGLHFARQIAQLHEGTLDYDPKLGFVIRLPKQNDIDQYVGQ